LKVLVFDWESSGEVEALFQDQEFGHGKGVSHERVVEELK
jgi:hypothetical protein